MSHSAPGRAGQRLGVTALLCLTAGMLGCPPEPMSEDAGPPMSVDGPGVCENADPSVLIGQMGVTVCSADGCAFGGADCEVDADCFWPMEDNGTMPGWFRPQGGVGTRYTVRVSGIADDDDAFESLRTLMVLSRSGTACVPDDCPGDSCPCDDASNETCLTTPEGSECAQVLADQLNRTFPTECRGDDAVHVEEIPIKFGVGFVLQSLDGAEFTIESHATYGGELYRAGPLNLTLDVGDFIYPASFDPLGGQGGGEG